MMDTLSVQAKRKPNSAGGHVFFAHFERDGRQFLLVVIVNDKLGAVLSRTFGVTDVQHLDVEGFRFAGRVNITAWASGEERYVNFLKGKGDVAEYFKEFLGCDATVQNKTDTIELVSALKKFAESQSMTSGDRDEFLAKAKKFAIDPL